MQYTLVSPVGHYLRFVTQLITKACFVGGTGNHFPVSRLRLVVALLECLGLRAEQILARALVVGMVDNS